MAAYACINGEMVAEEKAKIAISDLGLLRGYAVFDYFKTVGGKPVYLPDHLERLQHSATELRLALRFTTGHVEDLVMELTRLNGYSDCGTRITVTGGYSPGGYSVADPNLLISQERLVYDPGQFERGVRIMTYAHQRQLAQVKTIDYLQAIYLQPRLAEAGADEVLYYHASGKLRECPRANFFMVREGELITPAEGVLLGITRKKLLSLPGFRCREREIMLEELAQAEEAFICSTSKLLLPVLRIDGRQVGDGRPGRLTRRAWEVLREMQGYR